MLFFYYENLIFQKMCKTTIFLLPSNERSSPNERVPLQIPNAAIFAVLYSTI